MNDKKTPIEPPTKWKRLLETIRSPLRVYALVILVCNTVFGVAAAFTDNEEIFKFSVHMFLGVVGAFTLTMLWCPRLIYHPSELRNVEDLLPERDKPEVVTGILAVALVAYVTYQIINPC